MDDECQRVYDTDAMPCNSIIIIVIIIITSSSSSSSAVNGECKLKGAGLLRQLRRETMIGYTPWVYNWAFWPTDPSERCHDSDESVRGLWSARFQDGAVTVGSEIDEILRKRKISGIFLLFQIYACSFEISREISAISDSFFPKTLLMTVVRSLASYYTERSTRKRKQKFLHSFLPCTNILYITLV